MKNTVITKVVYTTLAMLLIAGCNSQNTRPDTSAQSTQAAEKITVKSNDPSGFVVTNNRVSAEFNNSETLTTVINEKLAAAGVDHTGAAKIRLEGQYTATGRVGNIKVDLGELIQHSYNKTDSKALEQRLANTKRPAQVPTTGGRLTEMGANATGSMGGGLLIDIAFNALVNMTGISGGFNKALTGDPRGVCLFNCSNWNKVTQAVLITASLEQPGKEPVKMRVMTRAFEEDLMPGKMVDKALDHIVNEVTNNE